MKRYIKVRCSMAILLCTSHLGSIWRTIFFIMSLSLKYLRPRLPRSRVNLLSLRGKLMLLACPKVTTRNSQLWPKAHGIRVKAHEIREKVHEIRAKVQKIKANFHIAKAKNKLRTSQVAPI